MAGNNSDKTVAHIPGHAEIEVIKILNQQHYLDSAQSPTGQSKDLASPPGKAASAILDGITITNSAGSTYDGGTTYDPGNQYDAGTGSYSTTPGYY